MADGDTKFQRDSWERPNRGGLYPAARTRTPINYQFTGDKSAAYIWSKVKRYHGYINSSVWELMSDDRPSTPKPKQASIKWSPRDIAPGIPIRNFRPQGGSARWRNDEHFGRLYRSGADAASQLLKRESPSGYYVMTDKQIAEKTLNDFIVDEDGTVKKGGLTKQNIIYNINITGQDIVLGMSDKEDSGNVAFNIISQKIGGRSASKEMSLPIHDFRRLMGAFSPVGSGSLGGRGWVDAGMNKEGKRLWKESPITDLVQAQRRMLKTQELIGVHEITLDMIEGKGHFVEQLSKGDWENSGLSRKELLDPDAFADLIKRESVREGGKIVPEAVAGGVRGLLLPKAENLYERALSGFVNPKNIAHSRAILNAFEQTFEYKWKKHVKHYEGLAKAAEEEGQGFYARQLRANITPEIRRKMRRNVFQRFMSPVLEAAKTTIRSQSPSGAGADVLRASAFTGDGLFGLFRDYYTKRLGVTTHELFTGKPSRRLFEEMHSIFTGYTGEKGIVDLKDLSKLNRFDDINFIKHRLARLDEDEQKAGSILFGKDLSANRLAAFETLVNKLEFELKGGRKEDWKNEEDRRVNLSRHLKIHYTFQEADPTQNMHGFGVWVHIIPTSEGELRKGQEAGRATQFFVPIEDINGLFHMPGGSRYMSRWLALSDTFLRHITGNETTYIPSYEPYRHGFVHMTTLGFAYKRRGGDYATSASRLAAMKNRVQGGAHLFSATETMVAHIMTKAPVFFKAMQKATLDQDGNLIRSGGAKAGGIMNQAIYSALGDEGGVGVSVSGPHTHEHLVVRNTAMIPAETLGKPTDFALREKTLFKYERWKQQFSYLELKSNLTLADVMKEQKDSGADIDDHELWKLERYRGNLDYAKKLYDIAGGDAKVSKFTEDAVEQGFDLDDLDDEVKEQMNEWTFKTTVGGNASFKSRRISELREALARSIPGLSSAGRHAASQENPIAIALSEDMVPGGTPYARPLQHHVAAPLHDVDDAYQNTILQRVESYHGKIYSDQAYQRNLGVGFILGAEDVETGQTYGEDDAMRIVGAYEQQIVASEEAEKFFGKGAKLNLVKVMAGMSKGTVVVPWREKLGEKMTWLDKDIHMFAGVSALKTTKKHESINSILIGQINMMMKKAGDDKQLIVDKLNSIMGEGWNFSIENGFIVQRSTPGKHLLLNTSGMRDPQEARKKMELISDFADKLNAMDHRKDDNDKIIKLVDSTIFYDRTGRQIKLHYIKTQQAVRVLMDKHPGTDMRADQYLYREHRRINPRINEVSIQAQDLLRFDHEGLSAQGEMLRHSFLSQATTRNRVYKLAQYMKASTQTRIKEGEAEQLFWEEQLGDDGKPVELTTRGQPISGSISPAQYEERYGRGMKYIELPEELGKGLHNELRRLYQPDEVPDGSPSSMQEMYRPSGTQKQFDKVIAELQLARSTGDYKDAIRQVQLYQEHLNDAINGKDGLAVNTFKSLRFKGKGFIKASLQQTLHGPGGDPYGAFTAQVSPELAERFGVTSDLLHKDKAGKFFWASILRAPDITYGRLASKIYVDDTLRGFGVYVHDTLRAALIGDSDGDKVRMVLAGMLSGVGVSKKAREQVFSEYAREFDARRELQEVIDKSKIVNNTFARNSGEYLAGAAEKGVLEFTDHAAIAAQQRVQLFQGLIRHTMNPILEKFYTDTIGTDIQDIREKSTYLGSAIGEIVEKFLKVKGKNTFDAHLFNTFITGRKTTGVKEIDGNLISTPETLKPNELQGAYNPETMTYSYMERDAEGKLITKTHTWETYMNEFFVNPEKNLKLQQELSYLRDWVKSENDRYWNTDEKYRPRSSYEFLTGKRDYLSSAVKKSGIMDRIGSEFSTGEYSIQDSWDTIMTFANPKLFDKIDKQPLRAIERVAHSFGRTVKSLLSPKQLGEGEEWEKDAAQPKLQARAEARAKQLELEAEREAERRSEEIGNLLLGPLSNVADSKSKYSFVMSDPNTWRKPVSKGAVDRLISRNREEWSGYDPKTSEMPTASALLDEASEVNSTVLSETPAQNALSLTQDGAKIAGEARKPTVMKNLRNPWLMAGIGGTIGIGALSFVTSRAQSNNLDMPATGATGGTIRVMSTEPGSGSAGSYNIQVTGRGRNLPPEAYGAAMSGTTSSVNVSVTDDTQDQSQRDKQAFINQLKGR